jgi:hypothetical protein
VRQIEGRHTGYQSLIEAAADHAGTLAILTASLLGGFVLGLRFRVLVLVPVIVLCIVVFVGAGIVVRASAWLILIAIAVNAISIQIGYLIGTCTAFALKPKHDGASAGTALPPRRTVPSRHTSDEK